MITRSSGIYTVFVDGITVKTEFSLVPVPDAAAPLTVGYAEGVGFGHLDGLIDEVQIYGRALTLREVVALQARGTVVCGPELGYPVSQVTTLRTYGFDFINDSSNASEKCRKDDTHYLHTGVDYDGVLGTDILAAADGTVAEIPAEANQNHGLGKVVIVEHESPGGSPPIYTLYAHLDEVKQSLAAGVQLAKGEPIGKMGKTATKKVHLHFEVKLRPVLENPIPVEGGPCGKGTCDSGSGNKCWGYTQGDPDAYGYLDPSLFLPTTVAFPASTQLVRQSASGQGRPK